MAIRFLCRRCRQLLAIATRKAGSEIHCPKCGESQLVPTQETANGLAPPEPDSAAAIESMVVSSWLQEPQEDNPSLAPPVVVPPVHCDEPAEETSQAIALPRPVIFEPVETPAPVRPIVDESQASLAPPGMVLLRRRTIHLQAVFFLLLAAGLFALGYYAGTQAQGPRPATGPVAASALAAPTMVEGQVIFESPEGRLLGDAGATVIALPEGKLPKTPLMLSTQQANAAPLHDLGGAQVRADVKGQFSLLLRPGNYRILFISAHARRAAGREIDEADLGEIRRYIAASQTLIGPFKYAWGVHPIGPALPPPNHDFGRSEAR